MLRDRRYWFYFLFTATTIALIVSVEDFMENDLVHHSTWEIILTVLKDIIVFTAAILVMSVPVFLLVRWFNRHYSWSNASLLRFSLEVTALFGLVGFSTLLTSVLGRWLGMVATGTDPDFDFEIITLIMFFISYFMLFAFNEFVMLRSDQERLRLKAEILEKQSYLTRYEALRNQINPHFLFNSLNVLSSLIYIDTSRSDQFIRKFAEVFRYVLELNQEKVVKVRQELAFIDSYLFLQKIRYGDSLIVEQSIEADAMDKYIPPLALELVLENAIKHNIITKEHTLTISITDQGNTLIIKNDYQQKEVSVRSTGVGQLNLIKRYELLTDRIPSFYVYQSHYVVELPLLNEDAC